MTKVSGIPTIAWVAAIAALATATQLILVGGQPLGWDETIYISQNANGIPAMFFSAPRSRGTSWLVWPIAHFTVNTVALNVYLSVLSAVVLILAFYPWTKVLSKRVTVLAAFLFAFFWVTIMFAPSAWPNYWLAVACLSAAGWFIVAANSGSRWAAVWSALSILIAAVFRFSDVAWLILALLVSAIAVPAWRRRFWLMGSIIVGFAIGVVPWVVEAYLNFGGPLERLRTASQVEGGMSPQFNVINVLRAASGPEVLCRPCHASVSRPFAVLGLVGAVLVVLAVAVAWRNRDRRMIFLPTACAVAMAVPYLFLVGWSAPRFLLPTYAFGMIPVAYALVWICRPSHARPYAIALTTLALGGNLAFQMNLVQESDESLSNSSVGRLPALAEQVAAHGVTPPCVIAGDPPRRAPLGFYTRCRRVSTGRLTVRQLNELIARYPTAVLVTPHERPPLYTTGWQTFIFSSGPVKWVVYYNVPTR